MCLAEIVAQCTLAAAMHCHHTRAVATESCPADAATPERTAQHAMARLRTKQYFDIATLAWDAKLESLVREACPLALAMDWSPEIDPEVVRWQAEVGYQKASHAMQRILLVPCVLSGKTFCCQASGTGLKN